VNAPPHTPKHLVLVSFAGGNASTTSAPLEVFEFAARCFAPAPPFEISVITQDGAAVTCGDFVTITPDGSIADARPADVVFLSGMPCNVEECLRASSGMFDWLCEQVARGALVAAVCPSQVLLAHAGLLNGRTVAMHWSMVDEVRKKYPAVRWTAERMVVEDQGMYSCCGTSSIVDLTLYLVHHLCGRDTMLACAQWFLADLPRVRQQSPPPLLRCASKAVGPMTAVEHWLVGHFHENIHFEALAQQFGMSWRTFYRHFQEAFGDPPKIYLQKMRLNAARRLLEIGTLHIDQIAARVGYADPAFFRTLFKRHVGMTPSHYRESFRLRPLGEGGSDSVLAANPPSTILR
jgi:transcriptional regulator GlxA family with amidase domain